MVDLVKTSPAMEGPFVLDQVGEKLADQPASVALEKDVLRK